MARIKKTRTEEYAGGFPAGMKAFQSLTDPRQGKAECHYFGEVLFIALAAIPCDMEGFDDFESNQRNFRILGHGSQRERIHCPPRPSAVRHSREEARRHMGQYG